jgi:hypothetical protein
MSWLDIWDTPPFPQMSVDKSIDRVSTTYTVKAVLDVSEWETNEEAGTFATTTVGEAFTFEQTKLSKRSLSF